MTDDKDSSNTAPFGNPDGSRATISQIQKDFVIFGGSAIWGGLATRSDDLTARVIVGRKGSGKTIYLRSLQAYASDQSELYADHIQQGLPTTESVVKFCQFFDERILTEKWMALWHRAILRSLLSHLMHSPALTSHVDPEIIKHISTNYKNIVREFGTKLSIYSQVSEIIQSHNTGNQITKYLEDPSWMELEAIIGDIIKDCPPICFYIDAVDEEFAHAPLYWHRCQKGLFYQTMRLLRDARFGGRLHVFICIRDLVMSAVYKSEHRTRYLNEPHIRVLNWDKEAITYFLNEKIKALDNIHFSSDTEQNGKTLESWLGIKEIHNNARAIDENILDYLLRHTRLLPRDIVVLGNALCNALARARVFPSDKNKEEIIRDTVADIAKFLCNEQLTICGNQLASNSMPVHAARQGYSKLYTGNQDYIRGITDDLKLLIAVIGKDKFTYDELVAAQSESRDLLNPDSDPFSVLWQNGLVGYQELNGGKESVVFYSESRMDDFQIPLNKQCYVFHSSLIDSVGIKPVGNSPVKY